MCIDHDPVVITRMHQLIREEQDVDYRYGELRDPQTILGNAAETLDLTQPVAALLLGVLHHLCPRDHPAHLVGRLMEPLAACSYLALSHLAADIAPAEATETFRRLNEQMTSPIVPRTREEVMELFGGLELVPPGVVQPQQWRPEPGTPPETLPMWCAIGRKA